MKHPNLARFLAEHFGGHPSAQAAADDEAGGSVEKYVEDFLSPMKGEGLDPEESIQFYECVDACETYLANHADFDALREEHFEDTGNPKLTCEQLEDLTGDFFKGFRFLCELVWQWN